MIIIAEVSEITRKIKLPTDRVLSVNGDYQVDGIAFKLPATYEGDFDFSTAAARVHWTGVDKVEHTNLLTDKDASGRPLWIMPSELTQGGHGVIEFAISFVATDETAAVTKRWISDPVSFRNRRTVNGSNEDEEAEEETTYDRLASAVAAVRAAQASVDEVNEVLAGITNSSPVVVATVADLSGLDVTKHQLAIVRADGYLYYYDGTAWQKGIKYGSYELDTTLTESGKAADAAAVGAEVSAIKEDLFNLKEYNVYDIIRDSPYAYENKTQYGVSWQWDAQNKVCTVSGTATQMTRNRFFVDPNSLHSSIVPGRKYYIKYHSTGTAPALYIAWFTNGSLASYKYCRENAEIEVPLNTTGCIIGLQLASGGSVNGTVSVQMLSLGQFSDEPLYGIDFAKKYFNFSTVTNNGVSFTWDATKRTCKVSGTATPAVANDTLYEGELPAGMNQGDEFLLRFKLDKIESIAVRVFFFDSNGGQLLDKYSTLHKIGNASADIPFRVPSKSATWRVKIYVPYRASDPISVDATITRLQLFKTTPRKMEVPLIVSFIDDDTTNDTYVTRFHDSCCHNGIKGNYAVITDRIGDTTSLDKLLQYEDEGFGMLIHAKDQSPSRTPYWTPKDEQGNPRAHTAEELSLCRANLNAGLRKMREDGFVNYNYWVTPGGHHEDGIIEIAKQSGVECMIPTNNGRYNSMQDCTRWIIRRISLSNTTQSGAAEDLQFVKDKIDEAVAAGGGWLIITTHYNDGWSTTDTWDDALDNNGYPVGYERFNEIAQYAVSAGMVPMSIPQAWEYYRPIIEANHSEYQRDIT